MSLSKKPFYRKNIHLIFLLLLVFYVVLIIIFAKDALWGKEGRYLSFAENLTKGFYSPPPPEVNLAVSPGYPLVLAPFKALNLPLLCFKLLNAFFLYFAVVIFYKTLLFFVEEKKARFSAVLLGLYFPFFKELPSLQTDLFSVFLMTVFLYYFCSFFQRKKTKLINVLIPSLILSYLAHTKFIFGYVLSAGIIVFLIYWVIKKNKKALVSALIFVLAFLLCIPYLVYTHSLTGKLFYWGEVGGVLYWMSTLDKAEYGDWRSYRFDGFPIPERDHHEFFDRASEMNFVDKDDVLKKEALKNIRKQPKKYLTNWIANVGRILFSYPYSYETQELKTYFTIVPNIFIVVFSILFFIITLVNYRTINQDIILLLIVISTYLFFSSLVSADRQVLFTALPVIGLWFAYIFDNFVRIKLDKNLPKGC